MSDQEPTTEEAAADAEAAAAEDAAAEAPPRELPGAAALAAVVEPFPSTKWVDGDDEWVVTVAAADYHDLIVTAKANGFETFIDLCAVDYFRRDPRFEIVVNLLDQSAPQRLRVRVGVAGDEPELSTLSDVYAGANFYEREAFDLFGVSFIGHPDLTRILLPDEWEGHPLRKDYEVGSVPIQFKDAHKVQ